MLQVDLFQSFRDSCRHVLLFLTKTDFIEFDRILYLGWMVPDFQAVCKNIAFLGHSKPEAMGGAPRWQTGNLLGPGRLAAVGAREFTW